MNIVFIVFSITLEETSTDCKSDAVTATTPGRRLKLLTQNGFDSYVANCRHKISDHKSVFN